MTAPGETTAVPMPGRTRTTRGKRLRRSVGCALDELRRDAERRFSSVYVVARK